jgi:hypothetical protein
LKALALSIHTVKPEEVDTLYQLSVQTFKETFEAQNTAEDMQTYIEDQLNLNQLTAELQNQDSIFYFARLDKEIVGYLKLNFNQAQKESVLEGKAFEIDSSWIGIQKENQNYLNLRIFQDALQTSDGYCQVHRFDVWQQ